MRDQVQVKQPGWRGGAASNTSATMGHTEKHDLYLTTTELWVTKYPSVLDTA